MPSVKWMRDEGKPRSFPIFKKITTIGRAPANDVSIEDDSLRDFHAQLVFDGRDFNLSESDAKSPISINGKKKRRSKIFHNDRLKLGDVELVFSVYDEVSEQLLSVDDGSSAELSGMLKLSEFNQRLMEIRSVPEQIRALLDAVIEVTDAAKGFVVLLDGGVPKVAAARGVGGADLMQDIENLSDSIIQRCIETRKPLIVSDALNDTMFKTSHSVMSLKLCSVMCAPLICQGQLLGIIYVGNDNVVSLFEQSSLDVLTIFAGQAALILQNAILLDELELDLRRMKASLEDQHFGRVIGSCDAMSRVFSMVNKVAPSDVSVLITGETGTGKELIAQEIHARSTRNEGPFVVVNCGAIPENLLESELFGHAKGAFTGAIKTRDGKFQEANKGTLFLDEIGEMPLQLQVKILRALQEHTVTRVGEHKPTHVDIRVLAATHRDLLAEIDKGTFREDLYYRLNVVNLELPPLRSREDDVVELARFFLAHYLKMHDGKVRGFTPGAIAAIREYHWPGNVRQLQNRVRKAIVLADKALIGVEDLDLGGDQVEPILHLSDAREAFTRRYILDVLRRNDGNRAQTARDLGVDPRTIFRYLEREPDAPEPQS